MTLKTWWQDQVHGSAEDAVIDHAPIQELNSRTLARLRLCRMQMRREGIYAPSGYTPPQRGESVAELWKRRGWRPR